MIFYCRQTHTPAPDIVTKDVIHMHTSDTEKVSTDDDKFSALLC